MVVGSTDGPVSYYLIAWALTMSVWIIRPDNALKKKKKKRHMGMQLKSRKKSQRYITNGMGLDPNLFSN